MIAQFVNTFGGISALLVAPPNWDAAPVRISLELPVDIAKAPITPLESRRVFSQSARYTMEWRTTLDSTRDSTELRIFLTHLRDEQVVAPLWTDSCELGADAAIGATSIVSLHMPVRYGAQWIIANEDFSIWEVVTARALAVGTLTLAPGTTLAWPAGTLMYPLIFGRLVERPKAEALTDETLEADFKMKENSAFARRLSTPAGSIATVGSHIATFSSTPLWTVVPNHSRPVDWTENPDVVYQAIGFLRQEQSRLYDHYVSRAMEFEFEQTPRSDIATIERLFRDRRGSVRRFMIPTWRGDLRLAADTPVPGHPTWINIEQPNEYSNAARAAQPGDPFIALIDADTGAIDPYQISAVSGGQLTAIGSVSAHRAADTIISHLLLARFETAQLEWIYDSDRTASTRSAAIELPSEYTSPSADLPEPAYLFQFTENLPTPQISRFTSYENSVVYLRDADLWDSGVHTPAVAGSSLWFQADGNLVLFSAGFASILWSSGTAGSGAVHCIFQADGNLVLYTAGIVPVWATGTADAGYVAGSNVNFALGTQVLAFGSVLSVGLHHLFIDSLGKLVLSREGTYTPAPYSFDAIRAGLRLDQEKLDFRSWKFTGNPLAKMFPFALDAILSLIVREVDVALTPAAAAVATVPAHFSGEVWSVTSDYKCTALAFGSLFERKFPRHLLSAVDNYTQFTGPTGLSAAAYKISGTLGTLSGQTIDVASAPANAKPADYFAGGWLETGTAAAFEPRSILSSAAISGGVRLRIDRPLLKSVGAQAIDLYPGYDGTYSQCAIRFLNPDNFGGAPFIPDTNPAVKAMPAKQVQGGKK